MNNKVLKIHDNDNVMVALQDLEAGTIVTLPDKQIELKEKIPAKHKFFISSIDQGGEVFMYGVLVGKAQKNLSAGERMTTENLKHASAGYHYRNSNYVWQPPDVSKFKGRTFNGYHRTDGTVGTANYWLFIPTVFCENRNLDVIREALNNQL